MQRPIDCGNCSTNAPALDHDLGLCPTAHTRQQPSLTTRPGNAVRAGLAAILPADREALLVRSRLIMETPALRARQADNEHTARVLLAGALATCAGLAVPSFTLEVLAAAALAALTTAVTTWTRRGGDEDLVTLVDEAFTVLHEAPR